jgi:hypothetical protein
MIRRHVHAPRLSVALLAAILVLLTGGSNVDSGAPLENRRNVENVSCRGSPGACCEKNRKQSSER